MYWTYNGINMAEYLRIIDIRGREVSPYELQTLSPIGSESDFVTYRSTPRRTIEIDFEIRGTSRENLRQKIDEISSILVTGEKVPVTFSDEPNITYLCEYAGATQSYENPHIFKHRGTITLLRDRYKYGPEQTVNFVNSVEVTNSGTVEAKPIIELTAKQKVTFAMVSDGTNYNMVGSPADVEQQMVDEKTVILNEVGDTLNQWIIPAQSKGSFVKGANGIQVSSYGTGDNWHGPQLFREISVAQDFEIEFYINCTSENAKQTFRISTNFFDENMKEIGLMRLIDNSDKLIRKVVECRAGGTPGVNVVISSKNYDLRNIATWDGLIRCTRKGNKLEFYAARITQNGQHVNTIKVTYNDVKNEFTGLLKFIRIDIAVYGNTTSATVASINQIKVTKFNTVTQDQTPYIADPGDVFLFDHETCQITKNGENIKHLKDFGGTYFTLKPGQTGLTVLPDGAFNAKLKFKPRYR